MKSTKVSSHRERNERNHGIFSFSEHSSVLVGVLLVDTRMNENESPTISAIGVSLLIFQRNALRRQRMEKNYTISCDGSLYGIGSRMNMSEMFETRSIIPRKITRR